MRNSKYFPLDKESIPKSGWFIIGSRLFLVRNRKVFDSWPLTGGSINDLIIEARKIADLSSRVKIYIDTDNILDPVASLDFGFILPKGFIPLSESELSDIFG